MGLADFVDAVGDNLSNAVRSAAGAGTMVIDQGVIDEVKLALHHAASEFDSGSFKAAAISVSHFGGSPEGSSLGGHHTRAHDVIQETLKGIVDDLVAFNRSVQKAADIVVDVDRQTETDLKSKLQIVEGFDHVVDHSSADAANDRGRNHQHYDNHSHPAESEGT